MTPAALEIIREIAALRGIPPRSVMGKSRCKHLVWARAEIARRLDARGYSLHRIGSIMGKDHTTVFYYLGRGKKGIAKRRWRAPQVRHLRWIRPVAVQSPPKRYLLPYAGAYMPEYHREEA